MSLITSEEKKSVLSIAEREDAKLIAEIIENKNENIKYAIANLQEK